MQFLRKAVMVGLEKKLTLYGFNNLTKTLSFNIFDVCYAKSEREKQDYIKYIDEQYNSERLTNILCDVTEMIGATVLNISRQDYEPQGASVNVLIAEGGVAPESVDPSCNQGDGFLLRRDIHAHLDKSHVTVHTFPESHPDNEVTTFRVDIDVSTCGEISPLNTLDYLIRSFDSDIITIDYRVRGFTRDVSGKKCFMDQEMTSIQDFISEEILLRYDAQDVNVYQSNLFHTRMLIKELELQNYLFKTDAYELDPRVRLDITNRLRREMIEIFSGRNMGERCVQIDVNSMKNLDNLCHPVSVLRDAQQLAAEAFGAANAFFIINGATGASQAMIMSVCKAGEKLIMPRNVHRSAINALVVNGAVPVYVDPGENKDLGIPLGMSVEAVERAILANPDYYGVCPDIRRIAKLAHEHGMLLLADEAHGTHFYFGENLPCSAMAAGADMASVSIHKTGGSLTQSAMLLCAEGINADYVRQVINLTQTTSASYLLMVSLDIARRNLALNGREMYLKAVQYVDYAREEINRIGGYYVYGDELCNGDSFYAFDRTKLSIHTRNTGLAGIEVYDLLRDEYGIQIEFGDIGNILAIVTAGDRALEIERLISALSEIKRLYGGDPTGMLQSEYLAPDVALPPQQAFYADKKAVPLEQSVGEICSEFVMCYPPGIPILAPGERITSDIVNYIQYAKEKGCSLTGPQDMEIARLNVVKK